MPKGVHCNHKRASQQHRWRPGGQVAANGGAGTTGVAALAEGRRFVGIDINPENLDLARPRLTQPGLALAPMTAEAS